MDEHASVGRVDRVGSSPGFESGGVRCAFREHTRRHSTGENGVVVVGSRWKSNAFQSYHRNDGEVVESATGAGATSTQIQKGIDRAIEFASHRWSRTDERRFPTEREAAAALWVVDHFGHYLWGHKSTLVTDCSALIWLFKSQNLSP